MTRFGEIIQIYRAYWFVHALQNLSVCICHLCQLIQSSNHENRHATIEDIMTNMVLFVYF